MNVVIMLMDVVTDYLYVGLPIITLIRILERRSNLSLVPQAEPVFSSLLRPQCSSMKAISVGFFFFNAIRTDQIHKYIANFYFPSSIISVNVLYVCLFQIFFIKK